MNQDQREPDSLQSVALLGSYVPRRCGIGTFTCDLTESLGALAPNLNVWTVAVNDRPEGYRYPPRVWFEIQQGRLGEYRQAADFLNMSGVDVLALQHEFGLFGGREGQYILELLRRLRMPVVTTLHTVLKDPNPDQRETTRQLAQVSDRLVVMAERAVTFLVEHYGIEREKINLIHHGIPEVPFVDPNFYKDQFGVEGRKVICTFGLLSPNKGIELMIDALPEIVRKHPDVVYIVVGATHPGVMAKEGEDYRLGLKRRAEERGVAGNIEFINKFVESQELVEFLGAADVYVTPYRDESQITSGTLAYALGTGTATVSTPYWYAQEMLDDGRGLLVPFQDSEALAEAINYLFDHETERHAVRKRSYNFTRKMLWPEVAGQYLDLFEEVREQRSRNPKPIVSGVKLRSRSGELAEIKLDHLLTMTDDVGVLRRARWTVPDRTQGYATDDNARALIAVLLARDHLDYDAGANLEALLSRYLAFLHHAYDESSGWFRSVLEYDRDWREEESREKAHGRSMWGLGEAVARCPHPGAMHLAANLFLRALPACEQLGDPHDQAFALIGIHAYLRRFSGDSHTRRVREEVAHALHHHFQEHGDDDWPWPEKSVNQEAARMPHALLLAGRWMFDDTMIQLALRSLDWLWSIQTGEEGRFAPVGTDGRLTRGQEKARFDQEPIEAAAMIDAALEAYRVTEQRHWIDRADLCLQWFLGDNDLRLPVYDHTTGGCHDALQAHGVDENQSAPATLAWLLSLLGLYEHVYDAHQSDPDHARTNGDGPHLERITSVHGGDGNGQTARVKTE